MEKFQITKQGFERLKSELENLKNIQRPAIINQISSARELGDLKENAEYHSAREKQGLVEAQIQDLEDKFSRAEVVDTSKLNGDIVKFGAIVKLENLDDEKIVSYKIVSDYESNIDEGLISVFSPVARALLNKKLDDQIEILVPSGSKYYKILGISFN
jgi:transcription elongation factor GreA